MGEATGHAHAITDVANATVYTLADALFVDVAETVVVVHDEHDPVVLDPGVWFVPMQVEYTPAEIRRVLD